MKETSFLFSLAERASREAGELITRSQPVLLKSWDKDIKIDVDLEAHAHIRNVLQDSNIPILSEEDEVKEFRGSEQWIIDPLDGSFNFFRKIPLSSVSVALWRDGMPYIGVVFDFNRDELFSAISGQGAWLNGGPISISASTDKQQAVCLTGFPAGTDYTAQALEEQISMVQTFKKVRLLGSAALSLAYVACGRADAYYEKGIYLWDVAAGLALVTAAGGKHAFTAADKEGRCTVYADNGKNMFKELV